MFNALSLALVLGAATSSASVHIEDRNIRLSDLVHLGDSEDVVLATLPRDVNSVELSVEKAQALIAAKRPLARFALKSEEALHVIAPAPEIIEGTCYRAVEAVSAGHIVTTDDVTAAPCDDKAARPELTFDREASAVFAVSPVARGAYLGPLTHSPSDILRRNKEFLLKTGASGVTITRKVITAQTGHEGERVFVRTTDGTVFAVPVANLFQDETP